MDNEEPKNKYFKANVSPMLPQNTFKNKLAYITGGGTGLGKQMALTLSKLGNPEELANLVSYAVSDYSSWLNGEIIFFDGGKFVYEVI